MSASAVAATCDEGYWLDGATCTMCGFSEPGFYCPGDDTQHPCPENKYIPAFDNLDIDGTIIYYSISTWATGSTSPATSAMFCRSSFRISTDTGKYYIDGAWDGEKYWRGLSNKLWYAAEPGYYLSQYRSTSSNNWYRGTKPCTNAPAHAHYTGPGTPDDPVTSGGKTDYNNCPWECDTGYGRSGDECVPLCTAGATEFHVREYVFNIYPNDLCDSPAIRLGLPGGTCCVRLELGDGPGLNVDIDGDVYHTVN